MYVCMYVCMYIYIYIYISLSLYIYIYIYIYLGDTLRPGGGVFFSQTPVGTRSPDLRPPSSGPPTLPAPRVFNGLAR